MLIERQYDTDTLISLRLNQELTWVASQGKSVILSINFCQVQKQLKPRLAPTILFSFTNTINNIHNNEYFCILEALEKATICSTSRTIPNVSSTQ